MDQAILLGELFSFKTTISYCNCIDASTTPEKKPSFENNGNHDTYWRESSEAKIVFGELELLNFSPWEHSARANCSFILILAFVLVEKRSGSFLVPMWLFKLCKRCSSVVLFVFQLLDFTVTQSIRQQCVKHSCLLCLLFLDCLCVCFVLFYFDWFSGKALYTLLVDLNIMISTSSATGFIYGGIGPLFLAD